MTNNTTRTKNGTCVCDWRECSGWTEVFKQSSKYEKLGELACIKLDSRSKNNKEKKDICQDLFAATPPLEAKELLMWKRFTLILITATMLLSSSAPSSSPAAS